MAKAEGEENASRSIRGGVSDRDSCRNTDILVFPVQDVWSQT
ncbi:MAG: hypothetical protein Q7K11_01635 [Candidatus Berkelbacteria bacterium]|nr:hypothetical protein [Candidatus Berkelbacteria bacterium]